MDDGVKALTEKERQTLRLILRGHDAKSMANELGVSVHTINERLRCARRKLDVTSSKEAARILDANDAAEDESLADKRIGEASLGKASETGAVSQDAARKFLPGVFVMLTLFAAGLVLTSQLADTTTSPPPQAEQVADEAVSGAALDWLELVDASDWQTSFEAAGSTFRDVNTVSGWASASRQAREPLGNIVSRELLSVRSVRDAKGSYREVKFESRFANDRVAFETVTLEMEDGVWKPVGILIE